MALLVLEPLCNLQHAPTSGRIVIESDHPDFGMAVEELRSADCRRLALQYAGTHGVSSPGVSNSPKPYSVNVQGKSLDQITGPLGEQLSMDHTLMQPNRYRVDVEVMSGSFG